MSWSRIQRTCRVCQAIFTGTRGAKFCSIRCNYEAHVLKNETGCWGWQGSRASGAYGLIVCGARRWIRAHRFSYETFIGAIPKGESVLHKCDNPECTRPDHLFLGTQKDNVQDAMAKGRHSPPPHFYGNDHPLRKNSSKLKRGERHHNAVLADKDAEYILNSTEKGIDLAKRFGVSPATVSAIRVGRIWAHLHQADKSTPSK